ncbi:hypothetical protein LC653_12945 [Nostoc sp. CHAB 5784]|uniref:hypothetical protein n=1 Tax=Nostoc mirabile TaxID=2907820 RepID=UPI001E38397B|nr:hypothetical protein [Nostoc mirabile]MCC5664799.1 hypothetical protein [Nostoc mirabile CHAB5784]
MNQKQLEDSIFESIFEAVSDGSQREWTDEEKLAAVSDIDLFHQLKCWADNSLSDSCWHEANYHLVNSSLSKSSLHGEEEKTYISF